MSPQTERELLVVVARMVVVPTARHHYVRDVQAVRTVVPVDPLVECERPSRGGRRLQGGAWLVPGLHQRVHDVQDVLVELLQVLFPLVAALLLDSGPGGRGHEIRLGGKGTRGIGGRLRCRLYVKEDWRQLPHPCLRGLRHLLRLLLNVVQEGRCMFSWSSHIDVWLVQSPQQTLNVHVGVVTPTCISTGLLSDHFLFLDGSHLIVGFLPAGWRFEQLQGVKTKVPGEGQHSSGSHGYSNVS